ncbi:MAG TPA: hypothetical protein VFV98_00320, partial [Vicinamibacterales bacterium]|nr:hypothetical protein [Vicinamibacterales bacterium]
MGGRAIAPRRPKSRLLQETIRLDPDFGMAHVALARAIWEQRLHAPVPSEFRSAEIDAHLLAARDAAQLLTVEERYRVAAEAAAIEMARAPDLPTNDRHRQAAVTALEALRLLRPDDVTVLLPLLQIGDDRAARVRPIVERLVALRPNSPFVLVKAAARSAAAGDHDLARSLLARARPVLDLPTAEGPTDEASVTGRVLMFEDAWSGDDVLAAKTLAEE